MFKLTLSICAQRALSRQEELKERARLLLEQARRDAAMKAGNKNVPSAAVNVPYRATNICDVSQSCVCVCQSGLSLGLKLLTCLTLVLSGSSVQWWVSRRGLGLQVSKEEGKSVVFCVQREEAVLRFQLPVPASSLCALQGYTASPRCAGTVNRVTTSLLSTALCLLLTTLATCWKGLSKMSHRTLSKRKKGLRREQTSPYEPLLRLSPGLLNVTT